MFKEFFTTSATADTSQQTVLNIIVYESSECCCFSQTYCKFLAYALSVAFSTSTTRFQKHLSGIVTNVGSGLFTH